MKNVAIPMRVALFTPLFVLVCTGCKKDPRPAQWDVDLVAPLVITSLGVEHILADSLLDVAPDGALTLLFKQSLFGLKLDTALNVPDTAIIYSFALPVAGPLQFPAGSNFFSEEESSQLGLDDIQLSRLDLRSGELEVELVNMIQSPLIGDFALPGATFNGGAVQLTQSVGPGTPQQPASVSVVRDLSGHQFDLRGPQFNSVNTLTTLISAQLDPNGNGASVTDQDSVLAIARYRALVPQYARGYFGERILEVGPEETTTGLFGSVVAGMLDLDQVSATVEVTNGIGVDGQVMIGILRSINTSTGNVIDLAHPIIGGTINLDRAMDLGNGFTPSSYSVVLDNNNSNIDLFVENLPDRIAYAADLHVNPLGDISNGNDFLYYESTMEATIAVEIPLRLIATDLTLQNTVDVDLPGSAEDHGLQQGVLHVFATNGFPFTADLSLTIVDENGDAVSTLPVSGNIASGLLDANDLVQTPTASRLDVQLDMQAVDLLYAYPRIRIRTVFNTTGSGHVPLLEHYTLDLQLTARGSYIVNGDG